MLSAAGAQQLHMAAQKYARVRRRPDPYPADRRPVPHSADAADRSQPSAASVLTHRATATG
jgi:hypothetical protein